MLYISILIIYVSVFFSFWGILIFWMLKVNCFLFWVLGSSIKGILMVLWWELFIYKKKKINLFLKVCKFNEINIKDIFYV